MPTEQTKESGVLVFAGAGISMLPPSSLPNWYQFNEAVLDALADEVSSYTRANLGEWIFSELLKRRNETQHFAPDYMADIIAEEVGMDYFKIVQALDADETNAAHHALADLAKAGIVRAVVTTNFDRLIERAFDAAGVPCRVYATPKQFAELTNALSDDATREVPIVKVHGTASDRESMVDTMSQRLAGRPHELEAALATLYARFHILFIGFSGADLDYDPNYLGLRAAATAEGNKGFTFLVRTGDKLRASVSNLRDVWGSGAAIVEGTLPEHLHALAQQLDVSASEWPESAATIDRLAEVRQRAAQWAQTLGRLQNVNVLSSLLRASGDDVTAGRLFWGIWKHYRTPDEMKGATYARFNHLIGRYLLEYGFTIKSIRPPTSVGFTVGDAPFDKDEIDNAFQFLARANKLGRGQAYSDLAACYALAGSAQRAEEMISEIVDEALEKNYLVFFIDAAIAGGLVWSIAGVWSDGLKYLESARELAIRFGMEPRRARLCAHLVRFLTWKNRFGEAAARYEEGMHIAERLGMESTQWELRLAWGYALTEQRRGAEAVPLLSEACDYFQTTGRLPLLTRAGLDLYYTAMLVGDQAGFDKARKVLEEFEHGYKPHVYSLRVEAGLQFNDLTYAREQLGLLREAAVECESNWGKLVAEAFEKEIIKREQAQKDGS